MSATNFVLQLQDDKDQVGVDRPDRPAPAYRETVREPVRHRVGMARPGQPVVVGEKSLELRRDYTLLAVLCLVCGIQNGAVSLVSRSVVRTTHLTGLTTDLGIGIVRVLNARRLHLGDEWKANFMRVGIIAFFISGSTLGYIAFARIGFRGFLFPCLISGTLFGLTLYFQVLRPEGGSQAV